MAHILSIDKDQVKKLGFNFGPCTNVGNCDRNICPFQHVDDPPKGKVNEQNEVDDKSAHVEQNELQKSLEYKDVDPSKPRVGLPTTSEESIMGGNEASSYQEKKCTACDIQIDMKKTILECHHCTRIHCLECTGVKGQSQAAKVVQNKSIKGIIWMCNRCLEDTKQTKDQLDILKQKALDQEQIIKQLQEEATGNTEHWRRQEENWQAQHDSYVQKSNENAVEIQVLSNTIQERNLTVAELNKTLQELTSAKDAADKSIQELKSDRSAKTKQITQLQQHTAKYKKLYEEEIEAGHLLKRTANNLNALVERFLTSPGNETKDSSPQVSEARSSLADGLNLSNDGIPPQPIMNEARSDPVEQQINVPPPTAQRNGGSGTIKKTTTRESSVQFNIPDTSVWGDELMDENVPPTYPPEYDAREQRQKARIYIGNIPPNMKESDVTEIFGHYIADESDITITKEVKRGREKSLYAMVVVKQDDVSEILNFNGMMVHDKQIVVEESKQKPCEHANKKKKPEKEDEDEPTTKPQCKFYLQGRCNKGDECEFEHRKPCNNYNKNGRCKFGEECRFAHINKNKRNRGGNNDLLSELLIKALAPQLSRNLGFSR